jgi:hypothetical protein
MLFSYFLRNVCDFIVIAFAEPVLLVKSSKMSERQAKDATPDLGVLNKKIHDFRSHPLASVGFEYIDSAKLSRDFSQRAKGLDSSDLP